MAATFLLVLLVQRLEPVPFAAAVEQPVIVRARDADDRPLPALPIEVDLPDGRRQELGVTDAAGELQFTPERVGAYCYRAMVDGVQLLAPAQALPPRRRWWYALACVPLGLALLWRNLRRRPATS